MNSSRRTTFTIISAALLSYMATVSNVGAADPDVSWVNQNMAWVLGPDSVSIRSPYQESQSTGFSWSIVPANVGAVYYPEGNVIADRLTHNITDLNAVGLESFEDYRTILKSVIDAWSDVSGIRNLGYIQETGEVMVGGIDEIVNRGNSSGIGHIRFMAYDNSVIPSGVLASATYIPDPEAATNNATNRARAGDVRFRSDSGIWAQGSDDGFNFRKVAMHEVGHVLGFGHNSVSDSVMGGGLYSELGLGQGDITGAIAIYGVPEPTSGLLLALGGLGLLATARRQSA